jgi:sulfite dehydrogenase (quinone) subunit SoeC
LNPAFSVVVFTTLSGIAQGIIVALVVATLAGGGLPGPLLATGLAVSLVLLVVALGASFLHLGRPERAWRAVMMWRTSWLSREVIVLPAFIAVVALWLLVHAQPRPAVLPDVLLPLLALVLCLVLWYCTAMIYACLRFIQEWAHPLTLANYTLIGLSSGLVLFTALAWLVGPQELVRPAAGWALALTVVAAVVRLVSIARNGRIRLKSNLQSATGIRNPQVVQKSMGMTGGSFNTREFMHGRTRAFLSRIKYFAIVAGFIVPALLLLPALLAPQQTGNGIWLVVAVLVQYAGLLAERWFFFAQARHPQNLYYQIVS